MNKRNDKQNDSKNNSQNDNDKINKAKNETDPNKTEASIKTGHHKEIALLKQIRSMSGITAEYLMTFLDRFPNQNEQHLIYSLCCNFHRLQHSIEVQLLHHGIHLTGSTYDPDVFENVSYVDVSLVEAIQTFLKDKEEIRQANKLFVN